jgi:replicative DNA helicase
MAETYEHEFEKQFVVALIHDPGFREYAINNITKDFLNFPDVIAAYKAVSRLDKRKNAVPTFMNVISELKLDIKTPDKIKEKAIAFIEPFLNGDSRLLESIIDNVIVRVENHVETALLFKAQEKCLSLLQDGKLKEIYKTYREVEEIATFRRTHPEVFNLEINEEENKSLRVIPLCVRGSDDDIESRLDEILVGGGLPVGNLAIFAASPKLGKTTLLLNIGLGQMLRGFNVNYYSLEVSVKYLSMRAISALTGISTFDLKANGSNIARATMDRIAEQYGKYNPIEFFQVSPYSLNTSTIMYDINQSLRKGRRVDSVIVDYVDLMGAPQKNEEFRHRIGRNTVELRALAEQAGCSVITATQLNRSAFIKDDVGAEAVSEDISKVFTADLFVILTKKSVKKNLRDDSKNDIICKPEFNRYGRVGKRFMLNHDYETGRMFDFFPD